LTIKVIMPRLAVTMAKGRITKWLKNEGETVQKGEPLFEVETEKIQTVVKALDAGILYKIIATTGAVVPVAGLVALMTSPGEELNEEALTVAEPIKVEEKKEPMAAERFEWTPETHEKISPLARKLAQKYGIDISKIKGTGPDGRIVKEDILREAERKSAEEKVEFVKVAEVREMSISRKVIAERLLQSHTTAVHVTVTTSVDMTETIALREGLVAQLESKTLAGLSYTEIITKVVSATLREYPLLNSSLEGDKIKIYDDVNIGVAVALDESLIVPVVHNADQKSLAEISLVLRQKIEKAKKRELSVDDVTGGTFTLSNLGIYDVEVFTPIMNPPQCALLGVGKIIRKPWVVNDQIVIRPIVTLSLSFDHRIIDGSLAARFLQRIRGILEKPQTLLK
jgi:pyruvate dehydrogenase E2 component (dihydrolipoamide acetyltransferase)